MLTAEFIRKTARAVSDLYADVTWTTTQVVELIEALAHEADQPDSGSAKKIPTEAIDAILRACCTGSPIPDWAHDTLARWRSELG